MNKLLGTLLTAIPGAVRNALLLAPTIIHFVRMAEAAFPGPGRGDEKKKAVLEGTKLLTGQLSKRGMISTDVHRAVDELAPELTDTIVDVLNVVKLFKGAR